jgi:hypothetical protein
MATFSADPELMEHLASTLDGYADAVEGWGQSSASLMQRHQYYYAATSVAGGTYGSASWARSWATSLRSRSSLLAAYGAIALMGSSAAGGIGAALGAGRQWALSEPTTLRFEDWYADRMAQLANTAAARALADELDAAIAAEDYEGIWRIIRELAEVDDPIAATAFFNGLGATNVGKLPNEVIGLTSFGDVHLRATVGHPADLISLLSRQLAGASQTGGLDFTGAELIDAELAIDILDQRYFTGYGAEYLFIANGFETTFLTSGVGRFLPVADYPVMAQQILVSEIDGQLPLDAREFLLPNIVDAGGGAQLVLRLLETADLESLLNPYAYLNEQGANAVGPILEQATVGLYGTDPLRAEYIIGTLINYAAGSSLYGNADVLAAALALVIPQLGGVVNGETASAFFGDPRGAGVAVSEASLIDALGSIAASDAATAALFESLANYYGGLVIEADGDPGALNRIAISLGELSSVLTTAVQEAHISDAADRDERSAALIGLIDTLSGLVPLPGAKTVGTLGSKLIKISYQELVDRGTALLETGYEGEARTDADATIDALLYSYTELLTVSYLHSQGQTAASIDEFFAASTYLDRSVYDFSDGAGGIATDLDEHRAQAYGQWVSFASADPAVSAAISRLLVEFLAGLTHYDG